MRKSESANRLSESDVSVLVAQIKDLEKKNAELKERNKNLASMSPYKFFAATWSHLRFAVNCRRNAMEKDAAVVAREDLSAQLRMLKKRLKDAEEEQYQAEEDAVALRAELNMLQQQAMSGSLGAMNSISNSPDQIQMLEKELASLKSALQQESHLRQQEPQQLAEEQAGASMLTSEKQELEEKLAAMSRKASEFKLQKGEDFRKPFINLGVHEDKEKLEQQLHDMAVVKDCLKHNEELRGTLDKLRTDQAKGLSESHDGRANDLGSAAYTTEVLSIKDQLAKEQSRAEALSAEVLQLSARLQQATQAFNGLARL
ncbi:hypothetical protein DVH24_038587 [Malus domestica]|uniref:Uncharacterized protein n=1 Tax=Malus domestica TaxID=3750 RepID=A0A498KFR9_MALDO|nr:hypothetical protein DVH24_038587 [Malus domestica]